MCRGEKEEVRDHAQKGVSRTIESYKAKQMPSSVDDMCVKSCCHQKHACTAPSLSSKHPHTPNYSSFHTQHNQLPSPSLSSPATSPATTPTNKLQHPKSQLTISPHSTPLLHNPLLSLFVKNPSPPAKISLHSRAKTSKTSPAVCISGESGCKPKVRQRPMRERWKVCQRASVGG